MRRRREAGWVHGPWGLGRAAAGAAVWALVLAALAPGGFGAPSGHVLQAEFAIFDATADGVGDALEAYLTVDAPSTGAYLVNATLVWAPGQTTVAAASEAQRLSAGISTVVVSFPGESINEKQLDGPYELEVRFTSSPVGALDENASFATPAFKASDFVKPAPNARPQVHVGPAQVDVSTPVMNASVSLSGPTVRWWPRGAPEAAASVSLPVVSALVEDPDPTDDVGVACEARLGDVPWALAALDIGPSAELGSTVRVVTSAPVRFAGNGCSGGVNGTASLIVLVAERNGTVPGALPTQLAGASEIMVSARVVLDGALPADSAAFELELNTSVGGGAFVVPTPAGEERLDPKDGGAGNAAVRGPVPQDFLAVKVVNGSDAVFEDLAWRSLSPQALASGQARFADVNASRALLNGSLLLTLTTPAGPDARSLQLDALAGAYQNEAPPPLGVPPPPAPPPPPSALVFAAALAAAAAMFFFSVYARAKKD